MMVNRTHFPLKKTKDNMICVNLGCGTKTNFEWNNVDFTPYARIRQKMWLAKILRKCGLLSELRWERLNHMDQDIICWNLKRGIPFPDKTFDVVYHSHLLEHLPKSDALVFLTECHRICKTGGIIRVVVPDLEHMARTYLEAVSRLDSGDESAWCNYDDVVYGMFDQMVRQQAIGTNAQKRMLARFEAMIRGGPERTGERHRWAYDRFSLARGLSNAGFANIAVRSFDKSAIQSWNRYGLDQKHDGSEYKPNSCYIEGVRP